MDTQFTTKVSGIPCICEVTHFIRARPGRYSGPPEDCYPDEPSEFEFNILDTKGRRAEWLENKLTQDDIERLEDEWEVSILETIYCYDGDD